MSLCEATIHSRSHARGSVPRWLPLARGCQQKPCSRPSAQGLACSCGTHLALCCLAAHESTALPELPEASSLVPAQPPLLPRAEGQLCSPCADRQVLIHLPGGGFGFKVKRGCSKTTSVGSTRCMATLLCFQKIPYIIFSMLNSFDLARQLVLPKLR